MAVVALAILADDGGPVLFRQKRIGHRGQRLILNKFSTMRVGASHALDARRAAMTGDLDPRIKNRAGAFLLKTRPDELPEIFNILAGQMNRIGPPP